MNKLIGLFLLALAFLAPSIANAAACFWVGGTGSINDVTHWSSGTGGAGSTCASAGGWPNAITETGTFDAASGVGTVTRNVSWTIGTLNIAAFTGTFGNTTDSSAVQLDTFANNGAGTRTFNMGTSTWTCGRPSTSSCTWQVTGATNLTLVSSTSSLVLEQGSSSQALCWFGQTVTYNSITFNPSTSTAANRSGWNCNTSSFTVGNVTIGSPNTIQFAAGFGWTITGTLSFSGGTPSGTSLVYLSSNSITANHTFTLSGGAATCSWCALFGITAVTNAITATNSFDLGRNVNTTITAPSVGGGGGGRIIGG